MKLPRRGFFAALFAPLIARCAPTAAKPTVWILPTVRIRSISPWTFSPRYIAMIGSYAGFQMAVRDELHIFGGTYSESRAELHCVNGTIKRWINRPEQVLGTEWHGFSFCSEWTPEYAKLADAVRVRMRSGHIMRAFIES